MMKKEFNRMKNQFNRMKNPFNRMKKQFNMLNFYNKITKREYKDVFLYITFKVLFYITLLILCQILLMREAYAMTEFNELSKESLQELALQINNAIELDGNLPLEAKHKNHLAIEILDRFGTKNLYRNELQDIVQTCRENIRDINPYNLPQDELVEDQIKQLKPYMECEKEASDALKLDNKLPDHHKWDNSNANKIFNRWGSSVILDELKTLKRETTERLNKF